MAFKIKDNLDLYGNQLLNFALQSDSGFPQSPQVGHMFNYTGTGVMANHAVICVDETTKAFKALAFVDEIATNAEFVELKEKVDLLIGDDVDTDTIIDSWKEVQAFLANIEDTKTLQGMLSSYLPKSGGTIEGTSSVPLVIKTTSYTTGIQIANAGGNRVFLGWNEANGLHLYNYTSGAFLGIKDDGTPTYNTNTLLHEGNYSDYALPKSGGTIDGSLQIGKEDNTAFKYLMLIRSGHGVRINNTDKEAYITFGAVDNSGYMTAEKVLLMGDGGLQYSPDNSNYHTLLHSGNIGEHKAGSANVIAKTYEGSINYTYNDNKVRLIKETSANWETNGFPGRYFGGLSAISNYCGWQLVTTGGGTVNAYFRKVSDQNTWSDWKTIAFTDSDITGNAGSATKLQTARTIWGQSFDGTGNITNPATMQYLSFANTGSDVVGYIGKGGTTNNTIYVANYTADGLVRLFTNNDINNSLILNSSGNVTIGGSDLAGTNAKLYVDGDIKGVANLIFSATKSFYLNNQGHFIPNDKTSDDYWWGVQRQDSNYAIAVDAKTGLFQTRYTTQLAIGNGNVLIGTTTDNGAKLQINNTSGSTSLRINSSVVEYGYKYNDIGIYHDNAIKLGFGWNSEPKAESNAGAYFKNYVSGDVISLFNEGGIFIGGNVLIGTPSELKSGAKLQIKGDVYVDGNIIATKEVSAGGAGTEGESGDGGAEVISQQLAKGQSTYTITNTIKRSDIAVSLYEWNANNGSWDMCLADISVKDATITVTFGSATSVNHKLVAVG